MGGPPRGPWSFPGVPWCPRVLEKISKIPKNYIKNIHAKKYPKLYSQHPFWGTWMPWGGPGGSKSSEGLRRGFFAPNRKVQKPNIVCIYPINNSPVVKIENFEISTLSPPPIPICKSVKLRPGEFTQVVFIYKEPLCKVSDFFLNISMNAPHFCFQWGLQWGNSRK